MHMDSRIGVLNSGQFYAFVNGYDQPEVRGTLAEVETALGLRPAAPVSVAATADGLYDVTLRFQYPAWDELNGVVFPRIAARSKAEAISLARTKARNEGHSGTGKGRYTFTAEPSE